MLSRARWFFFSHGSTEKALNLLSGMKEKKLFETTAISPELDNEDTNVLKLKIKNHIESSLIAIYIKSLQKLHSLLQCFHF